MRASEFSRIGDTGRRVLVAPIVFLLLLLSGPGFRHVCAESGDLLGSDVKKTSSRFWALMVGVSKYPKLAPRSHLAGPPHDVALLASVLQDRWAVRPEQIVQLTEDSPGHLLPTRANIEREFLALADKVMAGDRVLVFFAGHGSQQPDPDGDETDGLDEIFLPRDIGDWDGRQGEVENAIVDDTLAEWLSAIRRKDVDVFFVADCCHSGTLARGGTAIPRGVPMQQLKVPPREMQQQTAGAGPRQKPIDLSGKLPGKLVALYASQPNQQAWEDFIDGQRHGWLSWSLAKSIDEFDKIPIYRDLARRIHWHYQQRNWTLAQPFFEADAQHLDSEVLGIEAAPAQRRLGLTVDNNGRWMIDAGTLQGITPGSILAILDAGDDQLELVGYATVQSANIIDAVVVPVSYNDKPNDFALPKKVMCRLEVQDLGDAILVVDVNASAVSDPKSRQKVVRRVRSILTKAAEQPTASFRVAGKDEPAEWVVFIAADGSSLLLAEQTQIAVDLDGADALVGKSRFAAIPIRGLTADQLSDKFRRIAAARNLRQLAALSTFHDHQVDLNVVVEKQVDGGWQVLDVAEDLAAGDRLRVRIENPSPVSPVDVTVLYVESDFTIKAFFPLGFQTPRLEPSGGSIQLGTIVLDDMTTGIEDLIVIGVRARSGLIPANFTFLEQQGLGARQKQRGAGGRAWTSPLGRLTRGRVLEQGGARGANMEEATAYKVYRTSWEILSGQ